MHITLSQSLPVPSSADLVLSCKARACCICCQAMMALGFCVLQAKGCIALLRPTALGHQACRTISSNKPADISKTSWPVIIAGAGPTGLTLALWLSRFGVRSLILEKATEPAQHPQAHYINNRSMEVGVIVTRVLRPLWGLSQEIVANSPPLSHWRTFRYGFSMTGETLGVVDHFKGQPTAYNSAVSPEPVTHLPQHQLVPMMLSRATSSQSLVTLLWGHSVTGFHAQPDKVTVTAEDLQQRQHTFQGSFLAAADGAHSTVRQQLGIHQAGQEGIQNLINVHFTSPSLGGYLLIGGARNNQSSGHSKAAMLYFVFNPEVVGVVVAHNLARGEFVMQLPYLPPLQSVADFPEARCRQLITAASGLAPSQLMDLAIHEVRPWRMNAVIADSFQYTPPQPGSPASSSSPGVPRVFLVGDAAHRFPPAGGLGMNTGIQDAHNLAWKLALALKQPSQAAKPNAAAPPTLSTMSSTAPTTLTTTSSTAPTTLTTRSSTAPPTLTTTSLYPSASARTPAFAKPDSMQAEGSKLGSENTSEERVARSRLLVDAGHLLSTYEVERRPVVAANCALSMRNWAEAVGIPSALGLDPRAADALNTAVSAMPLVPAAAGKALLEAGLAVGRALTTTQWSPLRPIQLARIRAKFKSGITLRLQYPREDLGFKYPPSTTAKHTAIAAAPDMQSPAGTPETAALPQAASQAAVQQTVAAAAPGTGTGAAQAAAGTGIAVTGAGGTATGSDAGGSSKLGSRTAAAAAPADNTHGKSDATRDEPYEPSTEPGCRLPHVWLEPLQDSHRLAAAAAQMVVPDAFTASADEWAGRRKPDAAANSTGLVSTIDIAAGLPPPPPSDGDGRQMVTPVSPFLTLFVDGHAGTGNLWLGAWQALQQQYSTAGAVLPVNAVQVLPADSVQGQVPQRPDDACVRYIDVLSTWHSTMQLPYGSVLLVRPDGHVAWRHGPLQAVTAQRLGITRGHVQDEHSSAVVTQQPGASPVKGVQQACDLLLAALNTILQGTG